MRKLYPETFLVALAVILLEISYTRVFSYKLVYYFTYVVIGISLLGLGSGGVFVAVFERLRRMMEIRHTEDLIKGLFAGGLVAGSTHTCQGQEAVSVGIAASVRPSDAVCCTYRGHGHAMALGMAPEIGRPLMKKVGVESTWNLISSAMSCSSRAAQSALAMSVLSLAVSRPTPLAIARMLGSARELGSLPAEAA